MNPLATASVLLLATVSMAGTSLAQTPSRSRAYEAEETVPPPPSRGEQRGTVVSVTPIVQQVPVPRRVCHDEEVAVRQQPSGGGALFGAIVGGALGNAVGAGAGRAAATAVGVMAGAAAGNALEANAQSPQERTVRRCTTEESWEERTTSYNVVYEYGGRQYSTVMRRDPGRSVRVQVEAVPEDDGAPRVDAPRPRPRSAPPASSSRRPPPVYVERPGYYGEPEPAIVPYPAAPPPRYYYNDYYNDGPPAYAAPFGAGLVIGALIGYGVSHSHRGPGRYWRR